MVVPKKKKMKSVTYTYFEIFVVTFFLQSVFTTLSLRHTLCLQDLITATFASASPRSCPACKL